MESRNEVSSAGGDILLENIDSESLCTDDFSSSTSTELKTSSTSASDEIKTSSSSNTENGTPNKKNESETANVDQKRPSSDESNLSLGVTNFCEESEHSSGDRTPSRKCGSQREEGETRPSLPSDQYALQASLKQANQNHESFPHTLRRMLNVETHSNQRSIQWLVNGDGFEVIDQNTLEKEILPKYFPSSCIFQSFVRRLYRWGFLQVGGKKKPGHYIFSNASFHRDNDSYKSLKAIPRPRASKKQVDIKLQQNLPNSIVDRVTTQATAVPMGPNHNILTTIRNDLTSQLNSAISSYSHNPLVLPSWQGTTSNTLKNQITDSTLQNRLTSSARAFQPLHDQNMRLQVGNNEAQASFGSALVENVAQFLLQGQQGSVSVHDTILQSEEQQGFAQYAQGNVQPTLHRRVQPAISGDEAINPISRIPHTAGTATVSTTDNSATSHGQNNFAQLGTDPQSAPKKQRRSQSPP